jgi:hypothetical protein
MMEIGPTGNALVPTDSGSVSRISKASPGCLDGSCELITFNSGGTYTAILALPYIGGSTHVMPTAKLSFPAATFFEPGFGTAWNEPSIAIGIGFAWRVGGAGGADDGGNMNAGTIIGASSAATTSSASAVAVSVGAAATGSAASAGALDATEGVAVAAAVSTASTAAAACVPSAGTSDATEGAATAVGSTASATVSGATGCGACAALGAAVATSVVVPAVAADAGAVAEAGVAAGPLVMRNAVSMTRSAVTGSFNVTLKLAPAEAGTAKVYLFWSGTISDESLMPACNGEATGMVAT